MNVVVNVEGKYIFIIGGGLGIGVVLVCVLSVCGVIVGIVDLNEENVKILVEEIVVVGGKVYVVVVDVIELV